MCLILPGHKHNRTIYICKVFHQCAFGDEQLDSMYSWKPKYKKDYSREFWPFDPSIKNEYIFNPIHPKPSLWI